MAKTRIVFRGDISNAVGAEKENNDRHASRSNQGLTTEKIGMVSVLVNGGSYGYAERQVYVTFIKRYFLDTDTTETQTFSVSHGGNNYNLYVDFTAQRVR